MSPVFRDYVWRDNDIARIIKQVCRDFDVPVPKIEFKSTLTAHTDTYPGQKRIVMPSYEWAMTHRALSEPSVSLEIALHECAHWILSYRGEKMGHTKAFFALLFELIDIYGPYDDTENEAFMMRSFIDEMKYLPRFVAGGFKEYLETRQLLEDEGVPYD